MDADDKEAHDLEKWQENCRLIYVTLTRAALKSYISYMPRSYKKNSEISVFDEIFNKVRDGVQGLIEVKDLSQLRGESDMQGLMTGYVDLLFRHNAKY